ncbi:MAG: hypothetical protein KGH71_03755 [Candidatus Micrarchaeota archaeon]|nr:hypothetical protein [Candidatus Micrarchaeota archaeon]
MAGYEPQISPEVKIGDNCTECDTGKMTEDANAGEIICVNCGYVAQNSSPNKLQLQSSIRYGEFSQLNTDKLISPYKGKPSTLKSIRSDASGKGITGSTKEHLKRLKVLDTKISHDYSTALLLEKKIPRIEAWASKLTANKAVIDQTVYLVLKLNRKKVDVHQGLLGACFYEACKEQNIPITIVSLSSVSGIKTKELYRGVKTLLKRLNINTTVDSPESHLSKIANMAGASENLKRNSLQLIEQIKKDSLFRNTAPASLAASALYFECVRSGEGIMQKTIADASSVTAVTIRKNQKILKKHYS